MISVCSSAWLARRIWDSSPLQILCQEGVSVGTRGWKKPCPHLEVEGEGRLESHSGDIWSSLRRAWADVGVEENVYVLRGPSGASRGAQLEGPLPEGFGRSSRPPLPALHYNRRECM